MSIARTTNLLGALALGLSDEITEAAERGSVATMESKAAGCDNRMN
jgi:hypothetical protein